MLKNKFRWILMSFITCAYFIQFLDRVIISVGTKPIMNEFHFSATTWGYILSAFFWGLVPFTFVSGYLADKWGPKKLWTWGVTIWSIFTIGTASAFNTLSLVIARIFFGIGESPSALTGMRVVTNWFSPKEYTTAIGTAYSGVYLASAIGPVFIVWMIETWGWRSPFMIMGILGFIWLIGWRKLYTNHPKDNKYISKQELNWLIHEHKGQITNHVEEKRSFKELITIPKGFRMVLFANLWGAVCFGYGLFFLLTWLPGYLGSQRGLDLHSMGYALVFPWLGAAVASIIGGRLMDALYRWTGSKRVIRSYWTAACFLVVGVSLMFVVRVETVVSAVVWLTLAMSANTMASASLSSVIPETIPEKAGTFAGIFQACQTIPGIIAPILTGYIVDATHSFNNAFYVAAIIMASGFIIVLAFLRPVQEKIEVEEKNPLIVEHEY
jgi:MFS family permease